MRQFAGAPTGVCEFSPSGVRANRWVSESSRLPYTGYGKVDDGACALARFYEQSGRIVAGG